jgi:nicotinamidase-related amidase
MVIVGTTLDECVEQTIRIMKNSPGLIMLVKRDAKFDDKSNLTEVIFK